MFDVFMARDVLEAVFLQVADHVGGKLIAYYVHDDLFVLVELSVVFYEIIFLKVVLSFLEVVEFEALRDCLDFCFVSRGDV